MESKWLKQVSPWPPGDGRKVPVDTRPMSIIKALKNFEFDGKPLKFGLKGKYSLRVGQFRIIYSVKQEIITVFVLEIAHRKDVYR